MQQPYLPQYAHPPLSICTDLNSLLCPGSVNARWIARFSSVLAPRCGATVSSGKMAMEEVLMVRMMQQHHISAMESATKAVLCPSQVCQLCMNPTLARNRATTSMH